MIKSPLPCAVLEGPFSERLHGWRHYLIINPNVEGAKRYASTLGLPGRQGAVLSALGPGTRLYLAGTWEIDATEKQRLCCGPEGVHSIKCFPEPKPEIHAEIFGTTQKELPI